MKLIETAIPDVLIMEPTVFTDERGWFMESFNERYFHSALRKLGLAQPRPFVQDNHSCSKKGVLRGLHYQLAPYAQGKLVRVVQGAAFDVVVDIRKDSLTYGRSVSIELNPMNRLMLWVPEGFAHGFVALEDETHYLYKTTAFYNRDSERGIRWNDPQFSIVWPQQQNLIISEKDATAPLWVP